MARKQIGDRALISSLACLLCLLGSSCSDDTEPTKDSKVAVDAGTDSNKPDGKAVDSTPGDGAAKDGAGTAREVILLHTNDLHDHLLGWSPASDYTPATTGDDTTVGGFARLATLLKSQRTAAGSVPVLLLDGGDFTMGTLFSWLNTSKAPMLSMMQQLGYDAITLGNHEFDWGPKPLAAMLSAAVTGGFKVPVLASNILFSTSSTDDDALAALQTSGTLKSKYVKTLANGLKVGFFGILGKTAAGLAPLAKPVTFDAAATAAKAVVKELRDTDKVDLVVALSHSGTNAVGNMGDDADMATAVSGIDVIISGHTHMPLSTPGVVNNTLIVQTGSDGKYLGKLHLSVQGGKATVKKYELLAIDDKLAGDAATTTTIEGYITALDALLTPVGLGFKKVVAETAFDLPLPSFQETGLGNLITDAYRTISAAADTADPPVVAIEANGVIRDPIFKGTTGKLWFADVLGAIPLGAGPDGKPGYPLVTFYMHAKDLKAGIEVLDLAKSLMSNNDYWLQVSGLKAEVNSNGTIFDKVTQITLGTTALDLTDDKTCYRVITNLYTASMISAVTSATGGYLKIEPKLKDCKTLVTDMEGQIFKVSGAELKQWQALTSFMSKFADSDGDKIPDVPASYSKAEGRITIK